MRSVFSLVLLLLFPVTVLAQATTPAASYQQPSPHSSGADLLYYCDKRDMVVDQLRCDYYVQGVADLATIPHNGLPMACIPQGQTRTQLMTVALKHLQSLNTKALEDTSAASLILQGFRKKFPCPKLQGQQAANGKTSPEDAALFKKCLAKGGGQDAIKACFFEEKSRARKNSPSPETVALFKLCASREQDPEAIKDCMAQEQASKKD